MDKTRLNLFYSLHIIIIIMVVLTACDSNLASLDNEPIAEVTQDAVFEDAGITEAFVNQLYGTLGNPYVEQQLSSATDESHFVHGRGTIDNVKGRITPSNLGVFEDVRLDFYDWENNYSTIRDANIFFKNIGESPIDESLKNRLEGEALFIRAFKYWYLLRQWGGVPIIDDVQGLQTSQDELNVSRSTFGETVDFIVQDLDRAATLLPEEQTGGDFGRANKGAALALKSRVLLFAASDLFHNVSAWAPGFSNPELVGFTDGNQQQRWQAARDAAKTVIDLNLYSLHKPNPAPGDPIAQNYHELFMSNRNSEAIFSTFFTSEKTFEWYEANPGLFNGPNGYRNWGGNSPTQNLVDAFEMEDGSEFDWNNPDHTENPFQNRDPRLDAFIGHDRSPWRERLAGQQDIDPFGQLQFYATMEVVDQSGNVTSTRPGLENRNSPVEPWNGTFTNYVQRKFVDPDVDPRNTIQEAPYHHFRFAEILLNYAEASAEIGQEADARNALNRIRQRAGMPDVTAGGQDLIDAIRHERRIELSFENEFRYFDVRRWMIAPQTDSQDAYGITLVAERKEGDPVNVYTYSTVEKIPVQEREWNVAQYLLPIERAEINRNDQLIQNPNY